jgi:hypothetical protein
LRCRDVLSYRFFTAPHANREAIGERERLCAVKAPVYK